MRIVAEAIYGANGGSITFPPIAVPETAVSRAQEEAIEQRGREQHQLIAATLLGPPPEPPD